MIENRQKLRARDYIDDLAATGRRHFTSADARAALGVTAPAARSALARLARRTLIASPARGFYVIVPPECRILGCLPPDEFIAAQMAHEGLPYYAALMTAAEYHGAAHQKPMVFQVMVDRPRRPVVCGRVRVAFHVRRNLHRVATRDRPTPGGPMPVSTPEATVVDLVGYHDRAAGLDNVATILAEIEGLDPDRVAEAAATAPMSWAQRLGYLLDLVGRSDRTGPLARYVRAGARNTAILLPKATADGAARDDKWRLVVNTRVEPDDI